VLVAALRIDSQGFKHPLGLMEGATEHSASSVSFSIIAPSASMPAARQNRSKLADTSSQALPTTPIFVEGNAVGVVLILFMALLSFRGVSTPSLPAQGEQRRFFYFNIQRDNPFPGPGAT
jgi:hypothetical protein